MSDMNSGVRPCVMALAVTLALGLSGCGGGSNVRPTPTSTPAPASGAGQSSSGSGSHSGSSSNSGSDSASSSTSSDIHADVDGADGVKTWPQDISGARGLIKEGSGTLALTGTNTYTGGTTINEGTLQIGNGGKTGSITGDVTDDGTLVFDRSDDVTFTGEIDGTGSLVKKGAGTLVLTAVNTYAGGTEIKAGTLQIGDGSVSSSPFVHSPGSGDVSIASGATLLLDADEEKGTTAHLINGFGNTISGKGDIVVAGTAWEALDGVSKNFSGTTTVKSGNLLIGEKNSDAVLGGDVVVESGATLRGHGTIGGNLDILPGGTIRSGGSGFSDSGTLTVNGSFTAADGSELGVLTGPSAGVPEGVEIRVGGDLTLNGMTLTVYSSGALSTIAPGFYSLFSYAGALHETNGGITLANGSTSGLKLATLTNAKRILLLNPPTAGKLEFWNANGRASSVGIGGGDGTWSTTSKVWTNPVGTDANGVMSPQPGFAVFAGTPGTVTIDDSAGKVTTSGLQFGTDGYVLAGDSLTLADTFTAPVVRVGDGSRSSASMTATIKAPLVGAGGMMKVGKGTLRLPGANTFSGGTTIREGTLVVGNAHALGSGSIDLAGGTLGFMTNKLMLANAITLDDGSIVVADGQTETLSGDISGSGGIDKSGAGVLILTGPNTFTGGAEIHEGILRSAARLVGKVDVDEQGILDGVPGIDGSLDNDGTVIVHDGETKVSGDYTGDSGTTLAVSLGSKLDVTGTVTLGGGTLEVTGADSGYVANTHTAVLTAGKGVEGTFAKLVKDTGVVFTSTTIHYGANEVWLDTTGLDVTVAAGGHGVGYTPASMGSAVRVQSAFDKLDQKIASGTLSDTSPGFVQVAGEFQQSPNLRAAQASLESLSGQLHAASAGMTLQTIDATGRVLSRSLEHWSTYDGGKHLHTWMRRLKLGGDMSRGGYANVDYQLNGWLLGTDVAVGPDTLAGFAFSQGNGIEQLTGRFDRNRSRSTAGMGYLAWSGSHWYAHGRVGVGHYHQSMRRTLLLGQTYQGVAADYNGHYGVVYGETGRRFHMGSMRLTPFVNAEYDGIVRHGFVEHGAGGFGLKAGANVVQRWQGGVGLKLSRQWVFGHVGTVGLDARALWRQTLSAGGAVFDASLVGMDSWQPLTGVGLSRHGVEFDLDVNARLSANTRFKLGYEYLAGDRGHAEVASADFAVRF